jgi:hypothetical protein
MAGLHPLFFARRRHVNVAAFIGTLLQRNVIAFLFVIHPFNQSDYFRIK